MFKLFLLLGSANALLSVAFGAFGAHGLAGKIPDQMLAVYHTGAQYHMVHALGLIAVALISTKLDEPLVKWSGWLLFAGIVLFSGSLYALAMTQVTWLGAITPLGGVAFLAGWGLLCRAAWKSEK